MPNGYTIAKVKRWVALDAFDNPVDGYRIAFTMDSGGVDWVFVPEREYNKERVHQLIAEKVASHAGLLS